MIAFDNCFQLEQYMGGHRAKQCLKKTISDKRCVLFFQYENERSAQNDYKRRICVFRIGLATFKLNLTWIYRDEEGRVNVGRILRS